MWMPYQDAGTAMPKKNNEIEQHFKKLGDGVSQNHSSKIPIPIQTYLHDSNKKELTHPIASGTNVGKQQIQSLQQFLHFSDELQEGESQQKNDRISFCENFKSTSMNHNAEHTERAENIQTIKTDKKKPVLLLLVCLYLLGSCVAGILVQPISHTENVYLQYYIEYFITLSRTSDAINCFMSCFSMAVMMLTGVFLAGLSAFGLPLVALLIVGKGMGSGILLLQLFAQYEWQGVLCYLMIYGITEALLGTCICVLAITAIKSASRIFKYTFTKTKTPKNGLLGRLTGQYLILLLLMMVACILVAMVSPQLIELFSLS